MIILDELNIVLRYDYLPLDEVLATLKARRPDLHVVVTGRSAKPALIELADLVTIRVMGEGFTWDTQDRARDMAAAAKAWKAAKAMMADPAYGMIMA
jgi:ATP:corrinoid adenosyltransferase